MKLKTASQCVPPTHSTPKSNRNINDKITWLSYIYIYSPKKCSIKIQQFQIWFWCFGCTTAVNAMLYSTSYIKSTRCFDFIIMYHKKCSPVSLISSAGFSSACNQWTKPLQLHLHMMMFFKQLSTETSVCLSQTLSQSSVWKVDILISRQRALHLIWLPWQNPIWTLHSHKQSQ